MIQQSSFLGVSLRTRRRRRALVVGYYIFLLAIAAVALYRQKFVPSVLLVQTLTLGGLFGGIKMGGPVKYYAERARSVAMSDGSGIQQLNLSGRRPFSVFGLGWEPLDERERQERDRAHYEAFRLLRWTLSLAFISYWSLLDVMQGWLMSNTPTLLWMVLLYVYSLPQSLILWTEPDETPDGSLTLVHQ